MLLRNTSIFGIFEVMWLFAFSCLLVVDCRHVSSALSTSFPPSKAEVVYTCLGRRANFLWTAMLEPGDEIVLVTWTFQSSFRAVTIAKFSSDDFLVSSSFMDRVRQAGTTGLTLTGPTLQDKGRYSVEVDGHDARGTIFSLNASADLMVGDSLMVSDGGLRVRQLPEAQRDSSGRWSVALACGHFLHPGPPPFNVTWTTPSGQIVPSSRYANHHFILLVPNPAEGGNYTCAIPAAFHQEACATPEEVRQGQTMATVLVDELRARFSLLESEVLSLRSQLASTLGTVEELRDTQAKASGTVEELRDTQVKTSGSVEELRGAQARTSGTVEELRGAQARTSGTVEELRGAQANTSATVGILDSKLNSLQVAMANTPAVVKSISTPRVGFNIKLATVRLLPQSSKVNFDHVVLNDNNAYNTSTSVFTAPVAGLYLFALTTRSNAPGSANADVNTRTPAATVQTVCRVDSRAKDDAAACAGVVALARGQQVWVQANSINPYFDWGWANCFTGYLIRPDL